MASSPALSFPFSHPVSIGDLSAGDSVSQIVTPKNADLVEIATFLDIIAVAKPRLEAKLTMHRDGSVDLEGTLTATVTQSCVVSLAPVKTRIKEPVVRRFVRDLPDVDDDHQMGDDEDIVERLTDPIDLGAALVEHLALALPPFPRAENANLKTKVFTAPGQKPMTDDDAKPFAGLAALRDKLKGEDTG